MALGWYMYWDLKDDYGVIWMSEKCSNWYHSDRKAVDWRKRLPPCPCKLTQALKVDSRIRRMESGNRSKNS
jgi:hypothetical protein